jgi:hypothetical protein
MKLILLAVVLVVAITLCGCGNPPLLQPIVRAHPIDVPKPPKNFAIKEPGVPETPDKEWVDIQNLQPKQYWRAYSDGAVVLKPSDWRVIITSRNNIDKWIATEQARLKEHNEFVKKESPDIVKLPEKKPWYKFW